MLQVIKAEDVRDGEPRWWCPDDAYAARTLEWIVTGNLHTEWRREADAFTLAIVDRPAPTPTPAPGLDLDAVERAAKMTADREVFVEDGAIYAYDGEVCFRVGSAENDAAEEEVASAIVATLNAAPALIAEVRALRRHYDAAGPDHNLLALLDLYHEREQAALAKLAEAKRLGLEAHRIADDAIGSGFILDSDKPDLAAIAAALGAL
jgi:hypothetical protein